MIEFFVEGNPVAQPRTKARSFKIGERTITSVYTPSAKIKPWKEVFYWTAKAHQPPQPIEGPVQVDLVFTFVRPKYHYTKKGFSPSAPLWHTKKPDRDNLEKAVLDCLKVGLFLKDDCQVCAGNVSKRYVTCDKPGVLVRITEL